MTTNPRAGTRLLFRVEPIPSESLRGYFCRVTDAHRYDSPQWLVSLAGLPKDAFALDREDRTRRIAQLARLEPEEYLAMCYRRVKRPGRFDQRTFCGKLVSSGQLNLWRPRVCSCCLRERSVWWAIWDLFLVAACPLHRCLLINQCPGCKKMLAWERPAVERCRCGTDLRTGVAEAASADVLAMNTLIYRAAGFSTSTAAELELGEYHFPPELARLALDSLLRLIRSMQLLAGLASLRETPPRPCRTELISAIEADQAATAVLRDWPRAWCKALSGIVRKNSEYAPEMSLCESFGNFHRHLFYALPRSVFGFIHDGFETFVVKHWKGVVRGHCRTLSDGTREKSMWISAQQAAKKARLNASRIGELVRQGRLDGIFHKMRCRREHVECWIKRASLDQWITARDNDLAQYMSRPEAQKTLGLHCTTLLRVAKAGLIRYVHGSERYFRPGFYFPREDISTIKHAFAKHAVPVREYSKPGGLTALRYGLIYLGLDSGLPALIQGVVDGTLVPVAYTNQFPGIMGYLFPAEQVRKYRCAAGVQTPPEGFLNYSEAASSLGWTGTDVIAGLVARGVLDTRAGYHHGRTKLVPASEIHRFASQYVAVKVLARRLHVTADWLRMYLKKSRAPVLAVPVGTGRRALFLTKELATQVRISPPEISRR
jgi:hypothetical protein